MKTHSILVCSVFAYLATGLIGLNTEEIRLDRGLMAKQGL